MYVFQRIVTNAGGTKYPRAKLNAQLPLVAKALALPRRWLGKSSLRYNVSEVQDTGLDRVENLRRINPAHRTPSRSVRSNKKIAARNDGFGRRATDFDRGFLDTAYAAWARIGTV